MGNTLAAELLDRLSQVLEEQLQCGFLDQLRSVVKARVEGTELKLWVATSEADEFFSAHVNQQRVIILSRPVAPIEKITVIRVEASPHKGRS